MANKTAVTKTKKIILGDSSAFFHDPYTNISIAKGEIKELTQGQLGTKRIRSAMASGHLQNYTDSEIIMEEADEKKLIEKVTKMAISGKDPVKSVGAFTKENLVFLCNEFDIEPEEEDTNEVLLEALFKKIIS